MFLVNIMYFFSSPFSFTIWTKTLHNQITFVSKSLHKNSLSLSYQKEKENQNINDRMIRKGAIDYES